MIASWMGGMDPQGIFLMNILSLVSFLRYDDRIKITSSTAQFSLSDMCFFFWGGNKRNTLQEFMIPDTESMVYKPTKLGSLGGFHVGKYIPVPLSIWGV